ncbi:aa3-type cytochrome c oxidase subunit IV [Sphingomonas sp.]|nr:aa3-type cytochrome c oxidase subunit IV [Sphingomonas sp.]HWK36681.1 aa3-type cytochrome c oxidase subunit IV [Sphingomonas sp.]
MADQTDIQAHEATYHGVMAMLKWGTVACAVIVAGVIFLIAG